MTVQRVDIRLHTFRSPKFESVVQKAINFFNGTPVHDLPPVTRFSSGGVYALYYTGNFKLYAKIAVSNRRKHWSQPIYVGKAVPPGWRTARVVNKAEAYTLYARLREHARSISQTDNLNVSHFHTQFIILEGLESDLVVPVEAELIRRYGPLWNSFVDGFGNHDPGKGRYNQARSEWDVLHPGRLWAARLTGSSPRMEDIIAKIRRSRR